MWSSMIDKFFKGKIEMKGFVMFCNIMIQVCLVSERENVRKK